MAGTFRINAQLDFSGPTNLGNVVSDVRRQLADISLSINPKVERGGTQRIAALGRQYDGLARTVGTANRAAAALEFNVPAEAAGRIREISGASRAAATALGRASLNANRFRDSMLLLNESLSAFGPASQSLGAADAKLESLARTAREARTAPRRAPARPTASSASAVAAPDGSSIRGVAGAADTAAASLGRAETNASRFGQAIGDTARRFGQFLSVVRVVEGVEGALESGVREAIGFQHEMVRLGQIGGTTGAEIRAVNSEVTRLASSLGTSSKDLAGIATTLRQADFAGAEVKTTLEALAKTSLTPTFESIQNTTEGVIALKQQFGVSAPEIEGYLGSINTVSGALAVESEDLVTAIRKAGGAFKAASGDLQGAKPSFDQLLALFSSVRSTTRESADEISTGLRTIFGRLQSDKVAKNLEEMGVNLRFTASEAQLLGRTDLAGNFVGAYEAVRRLSAATKDLATTDPRFAQIATEIGGYRQISRVIPLLQQFGTAERAYAIAQAGSNSLTADADKAQASFQVQLGRTREQFLALVRSFGDSDGIAQFGKLLNGAAQTAIKLAEALKPLVPLIGALAIRRVVQGVSEGAGSAVAAGFRSQVFNFRRPARVAAPTAPARFATGGVVPGVGAGDHVPAALQTGDFVVRKRSALRVGHSRLDSYVQNGGRLPALLEPQEYVVPRTEAKRVGYAALDQLNRTGRLPQDRYAGGGLVRRAARAGSALRGTAAAAIYRNTDAVYAVGTTPFALLALAELGIQATPRAVAAIREKLASRRSRGGREDAPTIADLAALINDRNHGDRPVSKTARTLSYRNVIQELGGFLQSQKLHAGEVSRNFGRTKASREQIEAIGGRYGIDLATQAQAALPAAGPHLSYADLAQPLVDREVAQRTAVTAEPLSKDGLAKLKLRFSKQLADEARDAGLEPRTFIETKGQFRGQSSPKLGLAVAHPDASTLLAARHEIDLSQIQRTKVGAAGIKEIQAAVQAVATRAEAGPGSPEHFLRSYHAGLDVGPIDSEKLPQSFNEALKQGRRDFFEGRTEARFGTRGLRPEDRVKQPSILQAFAEQEGVGTYPPERVHEIRVAYKAATKSHLAGIRRERDLRQFGTADPQEARRIRAERARLGLAASPAAKSTDFRSVASDTEAAARLLGSDPSSLDATGDSFARGRLSAFERQTSVDDADRVAGADAAIDRQRRRGRGRVRRQDQPAAILRARERAVRARLDERDAPANSSDRDFFGATAEASEGRYAQLLKEEAGYPRTLERAREERDERRQVRAAKARAGVTAPVATGRRSRLRIGRPDAAARPQIVAPPPPRAVAPLAAVARINPLAGLTFPAGPDPRLLSLIAGTHPLPRTSATNLPVLASEFNRRSLNLEGGQGGRSPIPLLQTLVRQTEAVALHSKATAAATTTLERIPAAAVSATPRLSPHRIRLPKLLEILERTPNRQPDGRPNHDHRFLQSEIEDYGQTLAARRVERQSGARVRLGRYDGYDDPIRGVAPTATTPPPAAILLPGHTTPPPPPAGPPAPAAGDDAEESPKPLFDNLHKGRQRRLPLDRGEDFDAQVQSNREEARERAKELVSQPARNQTSLPLGGLLDRGFGDAEREATAAKLRRLDFQATMASRVGRKPRNVATSQDQLSLRADASFAEIQRSNRRQDRIASTQAILREALGTEPAAKPDVETRREYAAIVRRARTPDRRQQDLVFTPEKNPFQLASLDRVRPERAETKPPERRLGLSLRPVDPTNPEPAKSPFVLKSLGSSAGPKADSPGLPPLQVPSPFKLAPLDDLDTVYELGSRTAQHRPQFRPTAPFGLKSTAETGEGINLARVSHKFGFRPDVANYAFPLPTGARSGPEPRFSELKTPGTYDLGDLPESREDVATRSRFDRLRREGDSRQAHGQLGVERDGRFAETVASQKRAATHLDRLGRQSQIEANRQRIEASRLAADQVRLDALRPITTPTGPHSRLPDFRFDEVFAGANTAGAQTARTAVRQSRSVVPDLIDAHAREAGRSGIFANSTQELLRGVRKAQDQQDRAERTLAREAVAAQAVSNSSTQPAHPRLAANHPVRNNPRFAKLLGEIIARSPSVQSQLAQFPADQHESLRDGLLAVAQQHRDPLAHTQSLAADINDRGLDRRIAALIPPAPSPAAVQSATVRPTTVADFRRRFRQNGGADREANKLLTERFEAQYRQRNPDKTDERVQTIVRRFAAGHDQKGTTRSVLEHLIDRSLERSTAASLPIDARKTAFDALDGSRRPIEDYFREHLRRTRPELSGPTTHSSVDPATGAPITSTTDRQGDEARRLAAEAISRNDRVQTRADGSIRSIKPPPAPLLERTRSTFSRIGSRVGEISRLGAGDLLDIATGRTTPEDRERRRQNGEGRRGRFAARLSGLTLGASIAGAYAPSYLENIHGTIEKPKGTQEGAKQSYVIGSALSGAAIGGQLGAILGPGGAAIGAVVGGLHSFTTAIHEAEERTRAVHFEKITARFSSLLDGVASGTLAADRGQIGQVGAGIAEQLSEARRRAEASGDGRSAYDNYLVPGATHVANAFTLGLGGNFARETLANSDSTILDRRNTGRDQAERELLNPHLANFQQVAARLATQVRLPESDLRADSQLSPAEIASRRARRDAGLDALGGKPIVEALARGQGIPVEQVRSSLDSLIISTNRQRVASDQVSTAAEDAEVRLSRLGDIADSIEAGSRRSSGLRSEQELTLGILGGEAPTARLRDFAATSKVGGVDPAGLADSLAFLKNTLGGRAADDLSRNSTDAAQVRRDLPGLIVEATSRSGGEDSIRGNLRDVLDKLPKSVRPSIEAGIAKAGTDGELLSKARISPASLSRELEGSLREDAEAPTTKAITELTTLLGDFRDRLRDVGAATERFGDNLDSNRQADLGVERSRNRVRSLSTGIDPEVTEPLAATLAPRQARIARLAGTANLDPANLADRFRTLLGGIARNQATAADPSTSLDDRKAAIGAVDSLGREANNLQKAFALLGDSTEETAAIQAKLNAAERERAGRLSFTAKLLTASPAERREIAKNSQLATLAARRNSFAGFNPRQIEGALSHLESVGSVRFAEFNGRSGDEIRDGLLDDADRRLTPLGRANTQRGNRDRDDLTRQSLRAEERAGAARQAALALEGEGVGRAAVRPAAILDQSLAAARDLQRDAAAKRDQVEQGKAKAGVAVAQNQQGAVQSLTNRFPGVGIASLRRVLAGPDIAQLQAGTEANATLRRSFADPKGFVAQVRGQGAFGTAALIPGEARPTQRPGEGAAEFAVREQGFLDRRRFPERGIDEDPGQFQRRAQDFFEPHVPAIARGTGLSEGQVRQTVINPFVSNISDPRTRLRNDPEQGAAANPARAFGEALAAARGTAALANDAKIGEARERIGQGLFGTTAPNRNQERGITDLATNLPTIRKQLDATEGLDSLEAASNRVAAALDRLRQAAEPASPPAPVVQAKSGGGSIFRARGTDTVPAMLTPREFVVNAKSAVANADLLHQINDAKGPVYRADGGFADPFERERTIRRTVTEAAANFRNRNFLRDVESRKRTPDRPNLNRFAGIKLQEPLAAPITTPYQNASERLKAALGRAEALAAQPTSPPLFTPKLSRAEQYAANIARRDQLIARGRQREQGDRERQTLRSFVANHPANPGFAALPPVANTPDPLLQQIREGLGLRRVGTPIDEVRAANRERQAALIAKARPVALPTIAPRKGRPAPLRRRRRTGMSPAAYFAAFDGFDIDPIPGRRNAPLRNPARYFAAFDGFEVPAAPRRRRLRPRGTDTVPAMLTPGEAVINAPTVRANPDLLRRLIQPTARPKPILTDPDLKFFSGGGFVGGQAPGGGGTTPTASGGALRADPALISSLANFSKSVLAFGAAAAELRQFDSSVADFSKSARSLGSALAPLGDVAAKLVAAVAAIKLPDTIKFESTVRAEVVLNGTAALKAAVTDQIAAVVADEIGRQVPAQIKAALGSQAVRN